MARGHAGSKGATVPGQLKERHSGRTIPELGWEGQKYDQSWSGARYCKVPSHFPFLLHADGKAKMGQVARVDSHTVTTLAIDPNALFC